MRSALTNKCCKSFDHALFEMAAIPMATVDSKMRFVRVNSAFCKFVGYTRRELLRKTVMDVTHPDDLAMTATLQVKLFSRHKCDEQFVKRYLHKSGHTVWGQASAYVSRCGACRGKYVTVQIVDVTRQRQAEVSRFEEHQKVARKLQQLKKDLERKVRERTRRLRKLAGELSMAEHHERRRIAHILHEDLQQRLVAMKYQIHKLEANGGRHEFSATIRRLIHELQESIHLTRTLSSNISPPVLYELGLLPALEWLADDFKTRMGLLVTVKAGKQVDAMRDDVRVFAFEAVRELLFNVAKHSGVQEAVVMLTPSTRGKLAISVQDQGVGFDIRKARVAKQKFGLFSIQERAHSFGGHLELISHPGQGTTAVLTLPRR